MDELCALDEVDVWDNFGESIELGELYEKDQTFQINPIHPSHSIHTIYQSHQICSFHLINPIR